MFSIKIQEVDRLLPAALESCEAAQRCCSNDQQNDCDNQTGTEKEIESQVDNSENESQQPSTSGFNSVNVFFTPPPLDDEDDDDLSNEGDSALLIDQSADEENADEENIGGEVTDEEVIEQPNNNVGDEQRQQSTRGTIPKNDQIAEWLQRTYQNGDEEDLIKKSDLIERFCQHFGLTLGLNNTHAILTKVGKIVYQQFPDVCEARPGSSKRFRPPHYRYLRLR